MTWSWETRSRQFSALNGSIIVAVKTERAKYGKYGKHPDCLTFTVDDAAGVRRQFYMHHESECCESVDLLDVCGNFDDIIGAKVLDAFECKNEGNDNCLSWYFYRLETSKGTIVFCWKGESNGYYSLELSFEEADPARFEVAK